MKKVKYKIYNISNYYILQEISHTERKKEKMSELVDQICKLEAKAHALKESVSTINII